MRSKLSFGWYAPTHGDATFIGGRDANLGWSSRYIDAVAREAEGAGFDQILIPAGPGCADPFVTATHIALATTSLRLLVAVRTGATPPTAAAKAAATLDCLSSGRARLNIVTGGSPFELAMDGQHEDHDTRYRRTREYMEVLRGVWACADFTYRGHFYDIQQASLHPRPVSDSGIPLCLGGASAPAVGIAAELADVYLMWGEPVEDVQRQLEAVDTRANAAGRRVTCGMRVNLIVAEDSDAAWSAAESMVAKVDLETATRAHAYIADSDSEGLARIQAQAGKYLGRSTYWTGMVPYRSGNSSALVGNPAEVSEALQRYIDAGVREFIFSSYPHLGTAGLIGREVLPALRERSRHYE